MPSRQDITYTFDMRTAALNSLTPAIDVRYPKQQISATFNSDMTGGFPLNIPNGIDFDPQAAGSGLGLSTWFWLTTEKHQAILARNPGFSFIVFDDLEDAVDWDASTASGVHIGGRGTFSIGDFGSGSTITTNAIPLFGSAPDEGVLWAETAMYVPAIDHPSGQPASYSNPKDGRFRRFLRPYQATSTAFMIYDVSFNGGATFISNVFPGTLFNIPVADQGTSFKLRITRRNTTSPRGRILLLGWALVY